MIKFLATTLVFFGILVSQGHGYGGGYGGSYGGHYGGYRGGHHGGHHHGGGYHGDGYGYHEGHGGGNHGTYHEGGHGEGDYDHHGGYVGVQHGSAHYGIGYGGYNHGQKHLKQITEKTTEAPKQVTESVHSNVIMEQSIAAVVTDNSSGNEGSGFSNMQFTAVAAVETQETASAAGQKSYKLGNNGGGFSNDKSNAASMTKTTGTLNVSNLETVFSSQPAGTATQQVGASVQTASEASTAVATESSSGNEQSGFANIQFGAVNQQTVLATQQIASAADHGNYKNESLSGGHTDYKHDYEAKTSNSDETEASATKKINAVNSKVAYSSQQTGTATQQVDASIPKISGSTHNVRDDQIDFAFINQEDVTSEQSGFQSHKSVDSSSKHIIEKTTEALKKAAESEHNAANKDHTNTSNEASASIATDSSSENEQSGFTNTKLGAVNPQTAEATKQTTSPTDHKNYKHGSCSGSYSNYKNFDIKTSNAEIAKSPETLKIYAGKLEPVFSSRQTSTAMQQVGSSVQITDEASVAIATENSSRNEQSGFTNIQFGAGNQQTALSTQQTASATGHKNYEHGSYGSAHTDYKHDFETKTSNTATKSSAVKNINAGDSEATYGSQQTGTQKVSASIPRTSESTQNRHNNQKYFVFVNQEGEASEQSGFQSHKSVEVSSKHIIEKTTEAPKEAAESKYEEHTNTANEASAAIATESSSGNKQSGYANTQFGAVVHQTAIQTQGTASAESQKNYEHGSYGGAHNDYKHDFQPKISNTGVTESSAVKKINAGNSEVANGSQQTGTATQKVSASIPTTSESAQNGHEDKKYFVFVNQKGEGSEQSGFQSHKSFEVSSKHIIEKATEAPKEAAESKLKEHTNTTNEASASIVTESSSRNKESGYASTQFGAVDQHSAIATQQTASAAGHTNYKHGSCGGEHTNYKVDFETKTSNAETTDDTASASPKLNANNSEAAYGSQKTGSAIQTTSSGAQNKDQKYEHQSPSGHQYGGLLVKQFVLRNQEGVANEQSDSSSQKSGVASQNSSGEKITYSATQSGSATQQVTEGKDKSTTSGVASQNSSGQKITYSATQSGSATQQVTEGKDKSTTSGGGVTSQNSSGQKTTYSTSQSDSATQQVTEGKDKSTTSGVASQNSSGEKITYSATQSGSAKQQVTEGKDKSTTSQQNVEISQEAETKEKQVFDISSTDDENSHSDERETHGGNHKSHGKSNHGGYYRRHGGYGGYGGYHHRRGYGHY